MLNFTWLLLIPLTCLTKSDAEKIFGATAQMVNSQTENKDNSTRYTCTWRDTGKDIKPGDTCNLWYVLDVYKDETAAKKIHAVIVQSNKNLQGFTLLSTLGDEAFVHTDNTNFQLIMVRKANRIMRIKVNKITGRTSLEELKKVTGKIASTL